MRRNEDKIRKFNAFRYCIIMWIEILLAHEILICSNYFLLHYKYFICHWYDNSDLLIKSLFQIIYINDLFAVETIVLSPLPHHTA